MSQRLYEEFGDHPAWVYVEPFRKGTVRQCSSGRAGSRERYVRGIAAGSAAAGVRGVGLTCWSCEEGEGWRPNSVDVVNAAPETLGTEADGAFCRCRQGQVCCGFTRWTIGRG